MYYRKNAQVTKTRDSHSQVPELHSGSLKKFLLTTRYSSGIVFSTSL